MNIPRQNKRRIHVKRKGKKKSSHCSTCMHENVSTLAGHRIRRLSARHAAPILRGVAGAVVQSPAGARLQAGDDSTTLSVTPTLLGLSGAQNPGHRGRPPNARNARGPSSSCSRSFDPVRTHPPAPPLPPAWPRLARAAANCSTAACNRTEQILPCTAGTSVSRS